MGANVLTALAGTLFPLVALPPSLPNSPVNSPTSTEDRPTLLQLPSQVPTVHYTVGTYRGALTSVENFMYFIVIGLQSSNSQLFVCRF
jgi:hypothetical protein